MLVFLIGYAYSVEEPVGNEEDEVVFESKGFRAIRQTDAGGRDVIVLTNLDDEGRRMDAPPDVDRGRHDKDSGSDTAEPEPPQDTFFLRAIWHYARGRAFTAKGETMGAQAQLDHLRVISDHQEIDKIMIGFGPSRTILVIASKSLAGELAAKTMLTERGV